MARNDGLAKAYITTATTTAVKVGNGRLLAIILNKPVASSTITLQDGDGTTNVAFAVITNTTDVKPYSLPYNIKFTRGLRVITSGADDITVVYE